jgi:hypothetical protein
LLAILIYRAYLEIFSDWAFRVEVEGPWFIHDTVRLYASQCRHKQHGIVGQKPRVLHDRDGCRYLPNFRCFDDMLHS